LFFFETSEIEMKPNNQYPGNQQYPQQFSPQYPSSQYPGNQQYPQQFSPQYPQQTPQKYPANQYSPPPQNPQQYPYSQYSAPPQNPYNSTQNPQQQYPANQYSPPPQNPYNSTENPQQQYPANQYSPPPQNPYNSTQNPQQYPAQYSQNPYSSSSQGSQLQGWGQGYYNMIASDELRTLQAWFSSINRTGTGAITAEELATANFGGQPLGIKAAKKLVAAFDKDRNGTIEFSEYAALHKFISNMIQAFNNADVNRTGFLHFSEIHKAIYSGGFYLSVQTIQAICQKFDKTGRGISMSDFILVCAHLACVRSIFEWNDPSNKGNVTFNYDQFSHVTVYLMEDS